MERRLNEAATERPKYDICRQSGDNIYGLQTSVGQCRATKLYDKAVKATAGSTETIRYGANRTKLHDVAVL
jgi:hypothetical protein